MQMEMQRQRVNGNCKYSQFCNDFDNGEGEKLLDPPTICCNGDAHQHNNNDDNSFLISSTNIYPFPFSSSSTSTTTTAPPGGLGFIHHPVSRLDTLAGVAIKYGVEVTDIKKMNGLVTDLQMFALKSLQIPLPGRHPPSPCLSNGSDTSRHCSSQQTSPCLDLIDTFKSLSLKSSQRKVSPAMSSLQGYYGLKPIADQKISQGSKMEDVQHLRRSPASNTPLSHHRKSRSFINGLQNENDEVADNQLLEMRESDSEKWNEKLVRRRSSQPEMLMMEESSGAASSAITGKSLALRSKAASRTVLPVDREASGLTPVPIDSLAAGGFSSVRKSSSTSNLHDQDNSSSSIWPTSKWSLKPDLQALSAAAIGRPFFDGLPKPITGRRNKAALD
ncbi:hypothetical protein P3X46_000695 [Hevea brasiliensis]|uniref:LysM domain-containing protein n=1 Tax=Hevea brasiliensis TaxID=3981 RepID=A0ABQ9NAG3_HEVBR|nr:flocculation protein FLO11 [Hevea brasiliensis]KAJ9189392.1 hypothetical protein P3X46_000695 [Hevea brasiliensis]